MILIADSGSTKTDWCAGTTPENCQTVQTAGINPFHQSTEEIEQIITTMLMPQLENPNACTDIFFYGAGCLPEKVNGIKKALQKHFPQAKHIEVESDLLGAARALCGRQAGIACILGTGSNSCAYNGQQITDHISPLGYILGDEGSGSALGKQLVSNCLKRQLPPDLCQLFFETYPLSPAHILEHVYRQPLANRFLAGFTPFLATHRDRAEIHALLIEGFTQFFQRNVLPYACKEQPVHFTGSVAYHFQDEVKEAAQRLHLTLGQVLKSPMEGLRKYHFEPQHQIRTI